MSASYSTPYGTYNSALKIQHRASKLRVMLLHVAARNAHETRMRKTLYTAKPLLIPGGKAYLFLWSWRGDSIERRVY